MRLWVGLVVGTWGLASAARNLSAEARAWTATDVAALFAHVECQKTPAACLRGLARAAELVGRHVAVNGHALTWTTEPFAGTTLEAFTQQNNQYLSALDDTAGTAEFNLAERIHELSSPEYPEAMVRGYALKGYLEWFDRHADLAPTLTVPGEGLGLNLDVGSQSTRIRTVFARSAAARAGLRPGERVLALRRDHGTWLSFGVTPLEAIFRQLDFTSGHVFDLRLPTRTVRLRATPLLIAPIVVDRDRITLRDFRDLAVCDRFRRALDRLRGQATLTLDLRGNAGGDAATMTCIASLFVGPKLIYQYTPVPPSIPEWLGARPLETLAPATGPSDVIWRKPVYIWVDALTASAAETLTVALRAYRDDVWVLGAPTFGKRTAQATVPVATGLNLTYTLAHTTWAGGITRITPDISFGDAWYPREPSDATPSIEFAPRSGPGDALRHLPSP